ncbi:MAG: thioredoxin [Clostridia bacterium]|nr:thioredoxin [Clostridia bacterium]
MSVVSINNNNFEHEVLKSDRPVLLDFYADWCGPCKMVSPVVDQIAKEHPEYKIVKVNVDEQPELASKFNIMSIPALFVVKNGEIVNKSVGAKPKSKILEMLKVV